MGMSTEAAVKSLNSSGDGSAYKSEALSTPAAVLGTGSEFQYAQFCLHAAALATTLLLFMQNFLSFKLK